MTLGSSGGSSLNGAAVALAVGSDGYDRTGASAIIGQSIGGGGGIGASSYVSGFNPEVSKTLALGATGGGRRQWRHGQCCSSAKRFDFGWQCPRVLLQSIGAGGGLATSTTFASSLSEFGSTSSSISLGAASSTSGNGAAVTLTLGNATVATSIGTTGINSYGLVAQSIGGGGGVGLIANNSANGNNDGSVALTLEGSGGNARACDRVHWKCNNISTTEWAPPPLLPSPYRAAAASAPSMNFMNSVVSPSMNSIMPYVSTLRLGSSGGSGGNSAALRSPIPPIFITSGLAAPRHRCAIHFRRGRLGLIGPGSDRDDLRTGWGDRSGRLRRPEGNGG